MVDVSVIIPVRNEGEGIVRLLDDLRAQTRGPLEIVVVDAGSTDDTVAQVRGVAASDPRVRLVESGPSLPGKARNAGLRAARAPWAAFVDGGMRVPPEWLAELMAPADVDEQIGMVLGGLDVAVDTREQRAAALAFVPALRPTPTGGLWRGYCLPSSAVRVDAALEVNGLPEDLRSAEDLLFFERIKPRVKIAYAPNARVHWTHASARDAVWRRFFAYAQSSFRAGVMDDWFHVVARRYLLLLAATGPLLPASVGAFLMVRSAVMQRRKPEFVDGDLVGRARQLVEVATYLAIIDAATWAGWWRWRRDGKPRVAR